MSDVFWSNLPATIAALASLIGVAISLRNGGKIDEVHKTTNGMQAKMMKSAHIEGVAEGKAEEQANPTTVSVPKV